MATRTISRIRTAAIRRANGLPEPVRARLGQVRRSVKARLNDSARENFADDGVYLDHVVSTAIASAHADPEGASDPKDSAS